jgi:hypothetical protein
MMRAAHELPPVRCYASSSDSGYGTKCVYKIVYIQLLNDILINPVREAAMPRLRIQVNEKRSQSSPSPNRLIFFWF